MRTKVQTEVKVTQSCCCDTLSQLFPTTWFIVTSDHQPPTHPGGLECTCETNSVQWCLKLCKQQWSEICGDVEVDLNWGRMGGGGRCYHRPFEAISNWTVVKAWPLQRFCLPLWKWILLSLIVNMFFFQSTMLLIPTRRQHRPSASLVATKWRVFENRDQQIRNL